VPYSSIRQFKTAVVTSDMNPGNIWLLQSYILFLFYYYEIYIIIIFIKNIFIILFNNSTFLYSWGLSNSYRKNIIIYILTIMEP
jgi:hypothetical protein